eukprot:CAMPEP_0195529040 /NCGR_PEP_ID=MMETSP0794_2-20130614/31452_1 /TAXON_ID=515487 /ORGANISM="Stephanopyxis turris, Strain CCMP 815" /LENGTH=284 /DNA_ID=CAMNT_0040660281 /DNA_START=34 /DNA_END=888 /DNA_ORIENTATION=+
MTAEVDGVLQLGISDIEQSKPVYPTATTLNEPNATLYVSNIDWSIKKPLLRRSLFSLFSRHGKVLDVITLRSEGLRGQAWVIFEDVTSATAALREEQGFTFFKKDLKIDYAREKSDRVAKRDGTYVPKDRRAKRLQRELASKAASTKPMEDVTSTEQTEQDVDLQGDSVADKVPVESDAGIPPPPPLPSSANEQQQANQGNIAQEEQSPPSNILFAENLPVECNEMMLAMLFRQYAGYKEVRIPRQGLAFIEFDDEPSATLALRGLNSFKLTKTDTLKLKYGKA